MSERVSEQNILQEMLQKKAEEIWGHFLKTDDVVKIVKLWLQQKRHNLPKGMPKKSILQIENSFIDELLEELE